MAPRILSRNKVYIIVGIIFFFTTVVIAALLLLFVRGREEVLAPAAETPQFAERPVAPSVKWPDVVSPPEERLPPAGVPSDPFQPIFDAIRQLPSLFAESRQEEQAVTVSPSAGVTVTPQEVFAYGYPDDYLNILRELNQDMIDGGFLSPGEIYPLSSMEEVIRFQDKFADYLDANSDLSSQDIEAYRKAYREVLPKMWAEELRAKKAAQQTSFLLLKLWFHYRSAIVKYKINSVFAYMKENFLVNAVYAQGECYREGAPNTIVGSQRAAPCCNCSIRIGGRRFPIGCLNRICAGQPAIWDPTTMICGCNI